MWSQVERESELEKPATFRMVSLDHVVKRQSGPHPDLYSLQDRSPGDNGYRLSSGTLESLKLTLFAGLWEVLGLEILGPHHFPIRAIPKSKEGRACVRAASLSRNKMDDSHESSS